MIIINSKILFYEKRTAIIDILIEGFDKPITWSIAEGYSDEQFEGIANYIESKLKEQGAVQ